MSSLQSSHYSDYAILPLVCCLGKQVKKAVNSTKFPSLHAQFSFSLLHAFWPNISLDIKTLTTSTTSNDATGTLTKDSESFINFNSN
jgi:hypothetical protein